MEVYFGVANAPKRATSMERMSCPGSFSAIQRDNTSPMPPPWLNPAMTAHATQKFLSPRTGPTSGLPSGAKVNGPLTALRMPTRPSAGKCRKPTSKYGASRSKSSGSSCMAKSSGVLSGDHTTPCGS
jgi:hypothetical protein